MRPVYGGQGRNDKDPNYDPKSVGRFAQVELYTAPPLTGELSGLKVEYMIGLIYSSEAGKREITLGFDVGQGNQDLGFRGAVRGAIRRGPGNSSHDDGGRF